MDYNKEKLKIKFKDSVSETRATVNKFTKPSYAVRVNELNYSYSAFINFGSSGKVVLKNCSINVPTGQIYALLGSNGCGKTTLIRCIIGRLRPQSGSVTVFGLDSKLIAKNSIGYMPQDISLFNNFTVEENWRYFARLNRMADTDIDRKIDEFIQLMDLPAKTRPVATLSCGQQRRVSLTVALIHSPKLVILDEPTVGVDPILRHRLWNYMARICAVDSVTVIITTHYIEEARQASAVGFLRDGRLLDERDPEVLIQTYGCTTLEEVFLKLCDKQLENEFTQKSSLFNRKSSKTLSDSPSQALPIASPKTRLFGGNFYALFAKNLIGLFRINPYITVFFLILPAFCIFLFYWIAIHNMRYEISVYNGETSANYSRLFIDSLNRKRFAVNEYPTLESAINSVRFGRSRAALDVSANFSDEVYARIDSFSEPTDGETDADLTSVRVSIDYSEPTVQVIIPEMLAAYALVIQRAAETLGDNPQAWSPPIEPEPIYGSLRESFYAFVIPGVTVLFMFVVQLFLSTYSLVEEKRSGTLERSLVSGLSSLDYYLSHLAVRIGLLFVQLVPFLVTLYPMIAEQLMSHFWLIYSFLFLQGLAGIGFGFLVSSIVVNDIQSFITFLFVLFPAMTQNGLLWPLEGLPPMAKYSGLVLPVQLANRSLQFILFRGWSLARYQVWIGLLSNVVYIVVYLCAAIVIAHFNHFR